MKIAVSISAATAVLVVLTLAGHSFARQDTTSLYPAQAVMYASFAPNNSQVFIADGDGGNAKPLLAQPGYDYNASLSADSRWVTFTSERGNSADIYRVHPDGTSLERLTDDPAFDDRGALSPDGRLLAFVSTRGSGHANIWLLDLQTKKLTNLTAGSPGDFRPAWSPDGSLIAFSSIRDAVPLAPGADGAVDGKRYATDVYVMRQDVFTRDSMTCSQRARVTGTVPIKKS